LPLRGLAALWATVTILALAVVVATTAASAAITANGTIISNTVESTYKDAAGRTYDAQSNTVVWTVAQVAAMSVSPKETSLDPTTEGYPVASPIVRVFTITNTGNAPDAYLLTAVSAGGASVSSVAFKGPAGQTQAIVGSTVSPSVAPGGSLSVVVTVATTSVAVGTAFPIAISVRSTNTKAGNGAQSDSGREWAVAQAAASLGGVGGPATTITKLVNQSRMYAASPGDTVTYSIAFKNYGGSTATNVVLTDTLPSGVTANPATVSYNGASVSASATLNGQVLTVRLGSLAPGASGLVAFSALIGAASTGSSYVNVASLASDGGSAVATTPASVLIGIANIVFDGYGGSSHPVANARLTLRDVKTGAPVPLVPNPGGASASSASGRSPRDLFIGVPAGGLAPNYANANPYTTGADGRYSMVFQPSQLGTQASPAVYELDISAPGYRDRRIQISLTPADASGVLYNATLQDLDGQMLATPGGFALVQRAVSLNDVFGLLGNLPVFVAHPLSVTKTVDRDVAAAGNRLMYAVSVGNSGAQFGATRIVDTLPAGVAYAPGTARVDGVAQEPARTGRILTWSLPSLNGSHTITYAGVVLPEVTIGSVLTNVVDVDAVAPSGVHATGSSSAETRVQGGVLSDRIVITGRVFVDLAGTGRFHKGDAGVASVRVYLEDGESVLTDKDGRFTFPSVRPGQHVLRLDETTLPRTARAFHDRRIDSSRSTQQLVHGLFDADLMQDVEFALESVR
jgi:uncharacterized repeat protein (TIGR01451 family)